MDFTKYKRGYFMPAGDNFDWVKREYIDKAPIWCSVDLRDGNQALITPMNLEQKLEFFKVLCEIGFKEIEVGFPAASQTEYDFLRTLIENNLIPDDVTIQVLTQARPHIIDKTFDSLRGAKKVICHLYNSTSLAQREQVFKKSKQEIIDLAVSGAEYAVQKAKNFDGKVTFEYSPESFTGTEPDYALQVVNSVLEVFKPSKDNKVIINLPVTVELSMPHIYANQVEYMSKNINDRDHVVISLHPHNDRGTAIADGELGLLAGGDRIEGTLFGNGERTGNGDLITFAMNLYSHGVDPKLNFENMPKIIKLYEKLTQMKVPPRQPYVGELVYAAFSGSHQDAIAKGMAYRANGNDKYWNVPYLAIDPQDVGKEYMADVIRINSQSGKGGVSYLLESAFGYEIPIGMREELGYTVKGFSDNLHKELQNDEVLAIFRNEYINLDNPIKLNEYSFNRDNNYYSVLLEVQNGDTTVKLKGSGNGMLDSVSNAIKNCLGYHYILTDYKEHAKEVGSNSLAISYVSITINGKKIWGVGEDEDIASSSIKALLSAINRSNKEASV